DCIGHHPWCEPFMRLSHLILGVTMVVGSNAVTVAQSLLGHIEARSFVGPVTGQVVNFNVYLPKGYDQSAERYPVIYHLHGIGGNQGGQQNTTVPASFEAAKAQGIIGPVIVVFPKGYTDSWWADSI